MLQLQEVSKEVWRDNYKAPKERKLLDTWDRQARAAASIEHKSKQEQVYQDFLWLLSDFHGIAGGRITANLGVEGREGTTLFNCFAHNPADIGYKDVDSIHGIYDMLKAQALTLKSEGGYGMNFSWMRPAGMYVTGIGARTPGVLAFMELWEVSSKTITRGSEKVLDHIREGEKKKIRKGAQMGILEIWHPEIIEFIEVKLTKGRLEKFNLSTGITNGFMDAVINDENWELVFPDTEHEKYETEWHGNLENWKSKKLPVKVYHTIKARELWDKIMHATYTRNEPGVIFLDLMNKLNPFAYGEHIATTNPCITGDTLVAVADGKGDRTIKELADAGLDVPVYCLDNDGKIAIRTMRHPRWTGKKPVYKITLDGCQLRQTKNHEYRTSTGEYKEVKDLKIDEELGITYTFPEHTDHVEDIKNNESIINKKCEYCNENFTVDYSMREQSVCSDVCGELLIKKFKESSKKTPPTFNHRIISIEEDGTEDVYNGTVDEFHNFFVGGFKVNSEVEKPKSLYFNNLNCGEIGMSTGVCNLMSLNLVKFIIKGEDGKYYFDYDNFKKAVAIAVRFSDNINDISRVPLEEYRISMIEKRRIGIGTLGLGSLHYILGIKFGSEESLKLIEGIYCAKSEIELLTSARLGKEKGSFLKFDKNKYFNSYWWKHLTIDKNIKAEIEAIGEMRNSHHGANAPTGNMSVFVGCVSSGIEPVFLHDYVRWAIVNDQEKARLREKGFKFPDALKQEWFETKHMKFIKINNEELLEGKFEDITYRVDKNRGLIKENLVEDYGWKFVKENFSEEYFKELNDKGVFVTTDDLSVDEHINTLRIIAKYTNMNSSKTINIPKDYSFESFKHTYMKAWESGIKGVTTYRAGTMAGVLEKKQEINQKRETLEQTFIDAGDKVIFDKVKLPEIYYSMGYIIRDNNHKKWYVNIAFADKSLMRPFALFVSTNNKESNEVTDDTINSLFKLAREKGITKKTIDIQLDKYHGQSNVTKIARTIGFVLHHNIPVIDVVDNLVSGDFPFSSFSFHITRLMKKFIKDGTKVSGSGAKCPECKSESMIFQSGCIICKDCNWSKCG